MKTLLIAISSAALLMSAGSAFACRPCGPAEVNPVEIWVASDAKAPVVTQAIATVKVDQANKR